ncbi:hypothetical protein BC829DRAFT_423062 [Chytridium lagenaria]|nr:hypothetical protein BC829DRAFT_423062 [Chytridium lagenaria]
MGAFNLREPERHIEKLETYLMKNGIRADKEKVKELVGTFKKGDAKILYLRWLESKRDETGDPAFVPSYVDTCGWLVDKYGKEKTTSKTLERIARKSRKKGWTTRKFREEFTEAWDRKEGSITEEEGVRIFVEGLRGRVRDNLETKTDLYDQRKDSWIATVGLLAEATTSKKIRKMDEGRGNLASSDSESETSSSDDTSDSSESSESSSSSSSEDERARRRKKRIEKGRRREAKRGRKVHRERREERKEARLREEKTREEKQREERDKEVRMRMEERHEGSGGIALTLTVSEMAKLNQGVGLQGAGTAGGGATGTSTISRGHPTTQTSPRTATSATLPSICQGSRIRKRWCCGVLVKDYPHLQRKTIGRGECEDGDSRIGQRRRGQSNAVEGNAWREWSKKFIDADGGGSRSKTTDKKVVVDERSWEGIIERVGVDGCLPLNVFVATKGWSGWGGLSPTSRLLMKAKGISEMSLELARAHLEVETGVVGNVVMPLDDLIGVADRMNERDRRAAMVLLGVPEKAPTVIPAKVVADREQGEVDPRGRGQSKDKMDPKQNDGKDAAKAGGKRAKASIGGKVAPNVKPAASKKTPVAEVRKSAAAEIAAYVVGQEVAAGRRDGGDDRRRNGRERGWRRRDDEMEYYETSVASLTGESKRRNKPEKWPKKRALLAQCPHLAEVEVVSLEDGLYIPRVPNDDGSQYELVARGLALEIEKRGVKIDWEFKFNMRSANGQIDQLGGMIPNLPRIKMAATKTIRDPKTKEMTVWMENPEGYAVFYTAIRGHDERDVLVGDDGRVYKGIRKEEKDREMKEKMVKSFREGLREKGTGAVGASRC